LTGKTGKVHLGKTGNLAVKEKAAPMRSWKRAIEVERNQHLKEKGRRAHLHSEKRDTPTRGGKRKESVQQEKKKKTATNYGQKKMNIEVFCTSIRKETRPKSVIVRGKESVMKPLKGSTGPFSSSPERTGNGFQPLVEKSHDAIPLTKKKKKERSTISFERGGGHSLLGEKGGG